MNLLSGEHSSLEILGTLEKSELAKLLGPKRPLLLVLFSLIFFFCSGRATKEPHIRQDAQARVLANAESSQAFHLVFDLDWTLVVPLTTEQSKLLKDHPNLLKVHDEYYLLKEGAREILNHSFKDPNILVSFFSGGTKKRNDELLKKIIFFDGKSAFEKAYKVLSKQDLTVVSKDPRLRFSERYKKDIGKIAPTLERSLLIEDIEQFALAPGDKQTLWLGRTFFPRLPNKSWQESNELWRKTGVEERFLSESSEVAWWNQRKLFYLEGMLAETDDPGEIIDKAKAIGFSQDLAPKDWQEVINKRPAYMNYLFSTPCDNFMPL